MGPLRHSAWRAALVGLGLLAAPAVHADEPQDVEAPAIRTVAEAAIDPDSGRNVRRLPRVTIDTTGDLTVVFALRNVQDDPAAIGAAGVDDAYALLRAIYGSDAGKMVRTATVLGTYPVWGKFGSTRELPLLRVTLAAERAALLDWCYVRPADLATIAEDWWMQEEIRPPAAPEDLAGPRSSSCATSTADPLAPVAPAGSASVRDQVNAMLLHLNDTLHALSANEVGIARSQFKQFFDTWDESDDEFIKPLYPDRYPVMDGAEQAVELALLHSQPEDIDEARRNLLILRANLLEIVQDLEATGG